jgi:hypothetical protein
MKNEQNTFNTWYCIHIYSFLVVKMTIQQVLKGKILLKQFLQVDM